MSLSMALKETNRKHSGPQQSSNHRKPLPWPLVRKLNRKEQIWLADNQKRKHQKPLYDLILHTGHTGHKMTWTQNHYVVFVYISWPLGSSRTCWKPNHLVKLVWPNVSTFLTLCTSSWHRATWTLMFEVFKFQLCSNVCSFSYWESC